MDDHMAGAYADAPWAATGLPRCGGHSESGVRCQREACHVPPCAYDPRELELAGDELEDEWPFDDDPPDPL